ncbi:outer membrane beta-barrel protein [Larkinella sp. GY13]|uniref:outer membrane beta-barrel protein n=1 Tax=Larkinella sp. GY13 TaxID=3453720 RepID=UPI003EE84AC1
MSNSLVSAGGNVLDVLGKAPNLTVDPQSNTISLLGKQGVAVLINGKRSYLTEQELTSFLQNLPVSSIDRIEILTNPPARYESAGSAGLINIILKKDQSQGLNGTYTGSLGVGETVKYSSGVSMNYRTGRLNAFGSIDWSFNPLHWQTQVQRYVTTRSPRLLLDVDNEAYRKPGSMPVSAGVDIFLNASATLGVLANYQYSNETQAIYNRMYFRTTQLDSLLQINNDNRTEAANRLLNLNFRYTFDTTGRGSQGPHELNTDLDISRYTCTSQDQYGGGYYLPNGAVSQSLYYRGYTPNRIDILSIRVDYRRGLSRRWALETGYKGTYVRTDSDVRFEQQLDERWQTAPLFSRHFQYGETVQAGYISLNYTAPSYELRAGLRAEATRSDALLVTTNETVARRYVDLFPSLTVSRKLGKHQLRLALSRRIDRPNYQNLNPNIIFRSPLVFAQGNPFITPQYTQSVQFTHTYGPLVTTVGYSATQDAIGSVLTQDDVTLIQRGTVINMDRFVNVAVSSSYSLRFTQTWSSVNTASFYHNRFVFQYLNGFVRNQQPSINVRTTHNLTLPNNWLLEVSAFYQSPQAMNLVRIKSQGQLSIGVQKTFAQKRATLRINWLDILYTNTYRATLSYENLNLTQYLQTETRQARATFTYRLGSQNVKAARKRTTSTEDEQRRL